MLVIHPRCRLVLIALLTLNVISIAAANGHDEMVGALSSDSILNRDPMSVGFSDDSTVAQAVLPIGWRRTTRGWERAEQWLTPVAGTPDTGPLTANALANRQGRSINDWIAIGAARELRWTRVVSQLVRSVHPVGLAVFLVGAAVVITRLSEQSAARGIDEKQSPQVC